MVHDVIVIGTGPAGYTAALYTSRAFLKTRMIAGIQPGGQLTTTTEVDNYPGFAQGITGTQLMLDMRAQVERFGTEIVSDIVVSLEKKDTNFLLKGQNEAHEAKTVIVATGASAMYLGLPSESTLAGKGVSACATCDGFFFRGKDVVVVGGGDTAMEEATFLTKFASHVTIVHRREEFRASAIMLDRAKKDPKISIMTNKIVEEVLGETAVTGVRLKDAKTGEVSTINTQGFFLAIGHKPNTDFLKNIVELDSKGYIVTKEHTQTSMPGVFAAGDCVDHRYRQAIVAAGQGCMAAIDAQKWLEEQP
jgi:thioredoxin reductase (NADPH)